MNRIKNDSYGFVGILELVIIVAIAATIGAGGYFVYQRNHDTTQKTANTQVAAPKQTSTQKDKELCSDRGGLCVNYPQDWTLKTTQNDEPVGPSYEIVSPSGNTSVYYTPVVMGIGGGCPDKTCYFKAISIGKPTSSNSGNLNIVTGININAGAYSPYYVVSSDDVTSDMVVGQSVEMIYYGSLRGPKNDTQFLGITTNDKQKEYTNATEAEAWLSQPEVQAAGNILKTVHLKN